MSICHKIVNISITANSLFSEPSVWHRVLVDFKRKYETVDAAEAAFGVTVDKYIDGSPCQSKSKYRQPEFATITSKQIKLPYSYSAHGFDYGRCTPVRTKCELDAAVVNVVQ